MKSFCTIRNVAGLVVAMIVAYPLLHAAEPEKRLEIVAPSKGARSEPGASVTIRIRIAEGVTPATGVLITAGKEVHVLKQPPWEWTTEIPPDQPPGVFKIVAVVIDRQRQQAFQDEADLDIRMVAELLAIAVDPVRIELSSPYSPSDIFSDGHFEVWGSYADGERRKLTDSNEIALSIKDATIAKVTADREQFSVRGLKAGKTEMSVRAGPREVSVTVEVLSNNARPVAVVPAQSPGSYTTLPPVLVGAQVRLDGSLSYDPDHDALRHSWSVERKPEGSKLAIAKPLAAVTDLVVDRPGTYAFRLQVSDPSENADSTGVAVDVALPFSLERSTWSARKTESGAYQVTATILDDAGHPVAGEPVLLFVSVDAVVGALEVPWEPAKIQRTDMEGMTTFEVSPPPGKQIKLVPRIGGYKGFPLNKSVVVGGS